MTTVLRPSEPWAQTAEQACRQEWGRAALAELALRNACEAWIRGRWPDARVCHEMVIGEGKARADVVAVAPAHLVALEVKGRFDNTVRLLHQIGMFKLACPEVWMVVDERHENDAKLIRYLMPSIGLLVGHGVTNDWDRVEWARHWRAGQVKCPDLRLEVRHEAAAVAPVPECLLRIAWHAELLAMAKRLDLRPKASSTRGQLVAAMLGTCSAEDLLREVCTELRGRDALWRADQPIRSAP